MVYNGKSYSNWWFGGTPISGNLHILVPRIPASSWFSLVSVKFYGQIPHLSICKFLKGSRSACFPNPKFLLTFIKLLFQDIGQGLNDQCHYSITVSLLKRSQRRITELKVAGKKNIWNKTLTPWNLLLLVTSQCSFERSLGTKSLEVSMSKRRDLAEFSESHVSWFLARAVKTCLLVDSHWVASLNSS